MRTQFGVGYAILNIMQPDRMRVGPTTVASERTRSRLSSITSMIGAGSRSGRWVKSRRKQKGNLNSKPTRSVASFLRHALLTVPVLTLAAVLGPGASAEVRYFVTDLGNLGSSWGTAAYGINNKGQVRQASGLPHPVGICASGNSLTQEHRLSRLFQAQALELFCR